jgi:acetylglutamate kinase
MSLKLADAKSRTKVLVEALPWLQRFHQQIVVIKFGGNAMTDEALKESFAQDVAFLRLCGVEVDIGLVGDVVAVDPQVIRSLLKSDRVPVVTSIAPNRDGQIHNVNADTAAAALAVALGATKMLMLTDVAGLYQDWPTSTEIISSITAQELRSLLPSLSSGMIPKMEACLRAVEGGVEKAHVIDGRQPHAVLLELVTDEGVGTEVVRS